MTKPFEEGYEEGRKYGKPGVMRDENAKSRAENPYQKDTIAYAEWDRGWQYAQDGW